MLGCDMSTNLASNTDVDFQHGDSLIIGKDNSINRMDERPMPEDELTLRAHVDYGTWPF